MIPSTNMTVESNGTSGPLGDDDERGALNSGKAGLVPGGA
jgi:hypothetical protein